MKPHEYIRKQLNGIRQYLQLYTISKKDEQIHQLRLKIKKLRALLSFLEKTGEIQPFKGKVLSTLFRDAGRIRELQIHASYCRQYNNLHEISSQLLRSKNLLSERFISRNTVYNTQITRITQRISGDNKWPPPHSIKKYFRKKIQKPEQSFRYPGHAHQFRKHLKQLLYIYKALPAKRKEKIRLDFAAVDKLQQVLGKWHDLYAASLFFGTLHGFPAPELKKLKLRQKQMLLKIKDDSAGKQFFS